MTTTDERPQHPADVLAYTTEDKPQPQPLCYSHAGQRRANGTIVVHDAVRVEGRGWACADCAS